MFSIRICRQSNFKIQIYIYLLNNKNFLLLKNYLPKNILKIILSTILMSFLLMFALDYYADYLDYTYKYIIIHYLITKTVCCMTCGRGTMDGKLLGKIKKIRNYVFCGANHFSVKTLKVYSFLVCKRST